jgi:hypothetical protein
MAKTLPKKHPGPSGPPKTAQVGRAPLGAPKKSRAARAHEVAEGGDNIRASRILGGGN